MIYNRDVKYDDGKKKIENLSDEDPIKYYIQKKDEYIDSLNKQIQEYQEVFNRMSRFITPRPPKEMR